MSGGVQKFLFVIIVGLVVLVLAGLLIHVYEKEPSSEEGSSFSSGSIFEEVSTLDALNMGIIDGEELKEEHGIEDSAEVSSQEEKNVYVNLSLRSVMSDIKIKFTDKETKLLIPGVAFKVHLTGPGYDNIITDDDKDGVIYLSDLSAGDYTAVMEDASTSDTSYHADTEKTINVSEEIEYAKIDIKDEIKTEAEINVAAEDTKVVDADETTVSDNTQETSAEIDEGSLDEDISEEAEDLLAQIEAESGEQEDNEDNTETATSADITTTTEYVAAHSGSKGIDVSKHNGSIDFNAVKNTGIEFVIIRCGYRGSSSGALVVDPMFETNIRNAQSAGLAVGVYFFSQAVNETEAVEEASMVLELVSPYSLQYPIYIDVEKSNGRGDAISVDERSAVSHAFLSTVTGAGYAGGIYSNKLWFENRINTDSFTGYKIWLAQYTDLPSYTRTRYDMWQYTSKGSVAGVSGNVDMNVLK